MTQEEINKKAVEYSEGGMNAYETYHAFKAGFQLAQPEIERLKEENERLKNGLQQEECADDDQDDNSPFYCNSCEADLSSESHAKGCPDDDSPYAEYVRTGID